MSHVRAQLFGGARARGNARDRARRGDGHGVGRSCEPEM